jgi:hypothetical protein
MNMRWDRNVNLTQKRHDSAVLPNTIGTPSLGAPKIRSSGVKQARKSRVLILIVSAELQILACLGNPGTRDPWLAISGIHEILSNTRVVLPRVRGNRDARTNQGVISERPRSRVALKEHLIRRIVHHPIEIVGEQHRKARFTHQADWRTNQLRNSRKHADYLAGLRRADPTERTIIAGSTRNGSQLDTLSKGIRNVVGTECGHDPGVHQMRTGDDRNISPAQLRKGLRPGHRIADERRPTSDRIKGQSMVRAIGVLKPITLVREALTVDERLPRSIGAQHLNLIGKNRLQ